MLDLDIVGQLIKMDNKEWDLVVERYNHCQDIKSGVGKLKEEISNLELSIKMLKIDLRTKQDQCKHYITTYITDPSGNNDSCYECLICGDIVD